MKAAEYAYSTINEVNKLANGSKPDIADLTTGLGNILIAVVKQFMEETMHVAIQRSGGTSENDVSDSCLIGVFKEMDAKWDSFARLVNEHFGLAIVKRDGYEQYVFINVPGFKERYKAYRNQIKRKRNRH